ncbi:Subtilisin-like serine protease [Sandaracinus amylolyticus]|nr:Subtilisin-like serine protease [Sandaracinus amylolyticus]
MRNPVWARRRALATLAATCALMASACGDDDTTIPRDDAGPSEVDASPTIDAGSDAGPEREAPRVTSTRPRNGETLVAVGAEVELRFSEPMDETAGTITAAVGDVVIALAAPAWDDASDVVRVAPATSWPSGSQVAIRAEGFRDVAGNALAEPYAFVFETTDAAAPSVLETAPAEGATGIDPTLAAITIRFSEPMNPHLGVLRIAGGAGAIGARTWASPSELSVAIAGLDQDAAYRVQLEGFEDVTGNALDGAPVLADGAIDFTTAADEIAPTLVDSNPTHQQGDVDIALLRTITLQLSEPMDTSARTAMLDDGTATQTLTGNWSADGTTLTFAVSGRLTIDATHRLDLRALRDRAGNALDGAVGLADGVLAFTTSAADEALPFVVFTTPVEGGVVSPRTATVDVLFSEAMDTTLTRFDLRGGTDVRELTATWNAAGTRATMTLDAPLVPSTAYEVHFGASTDLSGNAIPPSHPYLVDTKLDFRTGAPTGEDCADPLTSAEASRDGDALVWTLEGGAFRTANGHPSCRVNTPVLDGVIEIVKTTPDVASGGRALRITATSADEFNGVQLEVLSGGCDPAAPGGTTPTRLACLAASLQWEQYLDGPAGTYYLWVSNETAYSCSGSSCSGTFVGATIRVEEVDAVPQGESCSAPYTAASPNHTTDDGADRWHIEHNAGTSSDYGTSTRGDGAITCTTTHGPDVVIRADKESATSFLDVSIEPFPMDTLLDRHGVYVEARSECAGGSASGVLQCTSRTTSPRSFQLDVPAGPTWIWVASANPDAAIPRADIVVREVEPQPGETCGTAIRLTPGMTTPVTPAATTRYFPPSCISSGPVTWYRFTSTHEVSLVGATGVAPVAVVDPTSGDTLVCPTDLTGVPLPRRAPVGTDVCIAVPSGSAISALSVQSLDWRGLTGNATDLAINRPVDDAGVGISITSEAWLSVTPSQLYLGINPGTTSAALIAAPRVGMDNASRVPVDRFAIGNAGVSVGETVFSVEETNRPGRLFRLVDTGGGVTAAGTPWDTGSLYTTAVIRAMALISGENRFILASAGTTTVPTIFYTASTTTSEAVLRPGENAAIRDVVAIAANASWVFVIGNGDAGRTVYRIPRANLSAPPQPIALAAGLSFSSSNGSMAYDETRDVLYFRTTSTQGGIYAVWDASSPTPIYAGPVILRGRSSDHGLAIDPAIPALFMFETETSTDGTFVEVR